LLRLLAQRLLGLTFGVFLGRTLVAALLL